MRHVPYPLPRIAALALATALAGCAGDAGTYPSLAPRPIEQLSTAEPAPAPEAAAAPVAPALAARYAAIVATACGSDEAFGRERVLAEQAAARARHAAAGSDAWIAAQQAVTRLEATRAPIGKALADLDAERTSGQFDAAALDAAEAQVHAIDDAERKAVDAVAGQIAQP